MRWASPRTRNRIQLEAESGPRLLGDYNELYSAFANLVFNAIQYTPDGGDIWLRWKYSDDGAVLEVEDTGIGVEEHHLPRLTERFYRVDKARSREVGRHRARPRDSSSTC